MKTAVNFNANKADHELGLQQRLSDLDLQCLPMSFLCDGLKDKHTD